VGDEQVEDEQVGDEANAESKYCWPCHSIGIEKAVTLRRQGSELLTSNVLESLGDHSCSTQNTYFGDV